MIGIMILGAVNFFCFSSIIILFYFGTWLFSVMQLVIFNSSSSRTSTRRLKKRHVSSTIIIMSTCSYSLPLLIVVFRRLEKATGKF